MVPESLVALVGAEIGDLLTLWSGSVQASLDDNLVGVYLTGSLTYADFVEARSDIDLAAVVKHALSQAEIEGIRRAHITVEKKYSRWAQRIECSYIPVELLASVLPPEMPRPWWGFGVLYEAAPYGNEWIINQYFLWKCGIALIGPEFKDLVDSIHIVDVQKACARDLFQEWVPKITNLQWLENAHHQSYLVLNLCRILYTVLCGEVGSKSEASTWVKHTFPQWKDLIEAAQSWQYGQSMDRSAEEAIALVRFAVDRINDSGVH